MTQEEKRIKIAKARGWKGISAQYLTGYAPWRPLPYEQRVRECPADNLASIPLDPLPDYFNDLNALYGAWESLTDDQKTIFAGHIRRLHDSLDVRIFAAFKRHGVECIGLTLNLWERGQ